MTLDESIKKLGNRFFGMSKDVLSDTNQILKRIEINFYSNVNGHKWSIFGNPVDSSVEEQDIKIVKKRSNDDVYYIISLKEHIDFIELISHAITIIEFNREMEQKMKLIEDKMNELSQLFQTLTYNELKTLKFAYKKKPGKKKSVKNENNLDIEVKKDEKPKFKHYKKMPKDVDVNIDEIPSSVIPGDL